MPTSQSKQYTPNFEKLRKANYNDHHKVYNRINRTHHSGSTKTLIRESSMNRLMRRRNLRVWAIRARRRAAAVGPRVLGFLVVYMALIWTLPFIFKGPRAWRVGEVCASSLPTPPLQGELVVLPDSDERIRNGDYHDFDLVDALERITDHSRRFLKTRFVITARVLSEKVTAPVFTDVALADLRRRTADLWTWLFDDTTRICTTILQSTRDTIDALEQQEEQCSLANPVGEHLAEDVTAEASSAEDASGEDAIAQDTTAEYGGPQDVGCSAESAKERDRFLHSARDLEEKMKPACDKIYLVLTRSWLREDLLITFRQEVKERMSEMVTELKFLQNVFMSLYNSNDAIRGQYWIFSPHFHRNENVGDVRLEQLVSRAETCYPGDLDPFTAVLLHILHGTTLLTPKYDSQFYDIHWKPPLDTPLQWPTRGVRAELKSQGNMINITSDLLGSVILPSAREWSDLMREVRNSEIFKMNSNDDGDSRYKRVYRRDRWDGWFLDWPWADTDKAARMVRSVEDGADYLEFLRGYLLQLRHGLPGMMTRLDQWDAEVAQMADDLKMVLSWGKIYTGRKRSRSQLLHENGTYGGSSNGGGGKLQITRWQIHPWNVSTIRVGLRRLERALTESWEQAESFNPKDSWKDNWFESEVHDWSRERATLRAEWEAEQSLKERKRKTFWQQFRNAMGRNWKHRGLLSLEV